MRVYSVEATWRSYHTVEMEEDADLHGLLQSLGNAELVGFTRRPIEEVLDEELDEFLKETQ